MEEFQKKHESDVFQIILKESETHQIRVNISPDLLEASGYSRDLDKVKNIACFTTTYGFMFSHLEKLDKC